MLVNLTLVDRENGILSGEAAPFYNHRRSVQRGRSLSNADSSRHFDLELV